MRKTIYKIDNLGFIEDNYVGFFNDAGELVSPKGDFITIDLPKPLKFYKPRFLNGEWIEGEDELERQKRLEERKLSESMPTREEIEESELELKIIFLLKKLGVI